MVLRCFEGVEDSILARPEMFLAELGPADGFCGFQSIVFWSVSLVCFVFIKNEIAFDSHINFIVIYVEASSFYHGRCTSWCFLMISASVPATKHASELRNFAMILHDPTFDMKTF